MTRKEKYLSNILQQLDAFLKEEWLPNVWIENTAMEVYVRQADHRISDISNARLTCLDVANISVKEQYRQQGFFTDFMMRAHNVHPFDMIYLECIHNPFLIEWCKKRGWICDIKQKILCFYLLR